MDSNSILWSCDLGGVFICGSNIGISDLKCALLPIYSGSYWFISNYVALMLVSPFLSYLFAHLTKKQHLLLLILLGILSFQFLYGHRYAGTMSLNWFVFLYCVAGYIKHYDVPNVIKEKAPIIVLGLVLCFFVAATALNIYKLKISNTPFHLMSSANDGVMFFLSTAVFIYFVGKDTVQNKIASLISNLAPYTLGVYLIHENPLIKKCGFWDYVIPEQFDIPIIVHCLLSCTLIFLICIFIDYIRARIFKIVNVDRFVENVTMRLPKEL